MTRLRSARPLALLLLLGAAILAPTAGAQQNGGTVRTLIAAINAGEVEGIQNAMAPDFELVFVGGTTVTGTEAQHLLVLLDTPITLVSTVPQGNHVNHTLLQFGTGRQYLIVFEGAGSGKIKRMTFYDATTPQGEEP
jgi:hypothetical protein